MHITDELVARLEAAINTVMEDAEVDYPIGYHKGMHRVEWDGAAMRAALLAALAPVEPVAWRCEGEKPGYWREGKHVIFDAELAARRIEQPEWWKVEPLFTSPPSTPSEDATDAVLAWMVAQGWLDADCEYTAADIITALDDNAAPSPAPSEDDLVAAREAAARHWENRGSAMHSASIRRGLADDGVSVQSALIAIRNERAGGRK